VYTAFVKAGSAAHDPATGERLAVFDPKTRAKAVFIHPAFLATSPLELTSTASLNTLSTAIEALESPKCDPISEALLMHAVRLTSEHLGNLTPQGTSVRERLAIAGVLCGRGTEQAGGGLASVLAHATGHRVHVANGTINAIVLPHTMRFNAPATVGTLGRIVESLPRSTSNGSEGAVHSLEKLFDRLGIARRLRDIGVAESDLTEIAEAAMADWFITRAPRKVAGVSELRGILEQAW